VSIDRSRNMPFEVILITLIRFLQRKSAVNKYPIWILKGADAF